MRQSYCIPISSYRPSSLDAYIFGYLEGILQTPLPSDNFLLNKMTACTNLVKFCERMRREFFPTKKISEYCNKEHFYPDIVVVINWILPVLIYNK